MAFLIRTISHSAEGREIVRASRVEGDRLVIGRGPDCHVHLTDLAVALRHATVARVPGRLEVRVEEGLSVELNGRKVTSGFIELAAGGDILIASHILRFMPTPADSDEVAVNVERVTESEVKLDKGAERMFSLASVMPSRRATAWILVLLVLAAFLAWPILTSYRQQQREQAFARFHADRLWSSGSLSRAHARLEGDCKACHVKPFEAVRDNACIACHTRIHDHADPFRLARAKPDLGRWARFQLAVKERFNLPPGRCVDCHTEHEGPQRMPATAQRFCSDCHADLKAKLPDTRIANAGDFGSSHPDFQPALITRWDGDRPMLQRISLARLPREDGGLKFPHAMHLSRTGGVAQMGRRLGAPFGFGQALECKDCHDPTPDGVRFQPVDMEEDCAMCHSLAFDRVGGTLRTLRHGEPEQVVADLRDFYRGRAPAPPASLGPAARRLPGEGAATRGRAQFNRALASGGAERAIRAVFSRGGACYDCHQVEAPPPGSLNFRIRPVAFPARYLHHGWFDHRPHVTESCSTCHAAERSSAASDLLLPDLATCRTCHGGEGTSKPVASSCAMCHDYHMDQGAPSMLIRQRVRGKKRDSEIGTGERR
jgi:cytochrome c3-like protein